MILTFIKAFLFGWTVVAAAGLLLCSIFGPDHAIKDLSLITSASILYYMLVSYFEGKYAKT